MDGAEAAERRLREAREILTSIGNVWWSTWPTSSSPLRGSTPEAQAAARRALKLVEPTDMVPAQANALLVLASALDARGMADEAATARAEAAETLRAKGLPTTVAPGG